MFLNLTLTTKIAPKDQTNNPEGSKKSAKAQNVAKVKTKNMALLLKPKLIVYIGKSQKSF